MEKHEDKLHRRQVELMKKRFEVDEEKRIVNLALNYEKATDLLLTNIDTKVPTFNRDKFASLKDLISEFPLDYKVNLDIKIDDYEDYNPEEILEGFNDAVELTVYSGNKDHRRKWVQITFLLVAGILVLFFIARGLIQDWKGISETAANVTKEILEITAWVFVWEAVSLAFLRPSEDRIISLTLAHRLNNVTFKDKTGNITAKEHYFESYENSYKEKKGLVFGKYSLLVSGAAFFALGTANLITLLMNLVTLFKPVEDSTASAGTMVVINIFMTVITLSLVASEILGGLSAICAYTGRVAKLHRFVLPFGIVVFILESIVLGVSIIMGDISIPSIIGVLIGAGYLIGAILFKAKKG